MNFTKKRPLLLSLVTLTLALNTGCTTAPAPSSSETPPAAPESAPSDASSSAVSSETENANAADLILKNGHIQTMVTEADVAKAVAVKGNQIVYVGDDAGVEAFLGKDTKVIDLAGRFVSPGFMDGHLHGPQPYYEQMFQISIPPNEVDSKEYLRIIREFVEKNPDLPLYYGGPFMQNAYQLPDGSNPGPQKEDLDAISKDKPIIIRDVSHHAWWVNSKALEIAGITKDTPDPAGGVIARNPAGEPSGLLTDAAKVPLSTKVEIDYTKENMIEAYKAFQEYCNSVGITGLTDINTYGQELLQAEALSDMDKAGELTLRSRYLVWGGEEDSYEAIKERLDAVAKYESELLHTGTVKIVYDGVTEGATAVMHEPYLPAAGKGSDWYGNSKWSIKKFNQNIAQLDKDGYQVHVHAIGDGGVTATLDAYEKTRAENGERDSRHTVVHVSAVTDADIKRFAELDVVSNLQFLWMYNDPLCRLEAAFIGEERAMAMYPAKNMLEAGCMISGGSDGAVTSYNPFEQIETGVTRNSPFPGEETQELYRWKEQALTPYQMLEIYTKNVAYQNFLEKEIGTIEVGKKADLVVLDQNILMVKPTEISNTTVDYTISNGRVVYEK